MHLGRSTPLFPLTLLLVGHSLCLPVDEHRPPQQGLAPRATYSVVPIDGGSDQGGADNAGGSGGAGSGSGSGSDPGNSPAGTVTVTVVETLPPKTSIQIVYKTLPPVTKTVTDSYVITETLEIVNIGTGCATSLTSDSLTTTTLAIPTSTLAASSQLSSAALTTASFAASLSPSTTAAPSQTGFGSGTTAHDDGKWHTSYPAWSGTLLGR